MWHRWGSSPSWTRSVLSHDQAIKWTKAMVRVYSDSILCVGQMNNPKAIRWEGQVEDLKMYPSWITVEYFPRISKQVFHETQKDLERQNIKPEDFTDRIIDMSMFNIDWTMRGNDENWMSYAAKGKKYAKKFSQGHWTFLGLGSEKKWYGGSSYENGTRQLIKWRFKETSHPVFEVSVPWVVESWKERKVKKPCTPMENRQTQSSCSRLFTLQISSVFTEQCRIGVNHSAWQKK